MTTRRRWTLAASAAALAAVAWLILHDHPADFVLAGSSAVALDAPAPIAPPPAATPPPRSAPTLPPRRDGDDAPYQVSLEKNRICVDEDVAVQVSDRSGLDSPFLVARARLAGTAVAGPLGSLVLKPSRLYQDFRAGKLDTRRIPRGTLEALDPPRVVVEIIDTRREGEGAIVHRTEVSIAVERCGDPSPALQVSCDEGTDGAEPGAYRCLAVPPAGLVPVVYDWDFGDGRTGQTGQGEALISYRMRPQQQAMSSYVVSVAARDAEGKIARGRTSIGIANDVWLEAQQNKKYVLRLKFTPWPELVDGHYRSEVTIFNPFDEAMVFTRAEVRRHPCIDQHTVTLPPPKVEPTTPQKLLGRTRLSPGEDFRITYSEPASAFGSAYCGLTVIAEGKAESRGWPVTAAWKIPIPRP
jgi:hypothetical protein